MLQFYLFIILFGLFLSIFLLIGYQVAPKIYASLRIKSYISPKEKVRKQVRPQKRISNNFKRQLYVKLELSLKRAHIPITPQKFLLLIIIANVLAGLICLYTNIIICTLILSLINFFILLSIKHLQTKHKNQMISQLPEVLELISSSLKAGYSIVQSLNSVAEENYGTLSKEFSYTIQSVKFGDQLDEALLDLKKRIDIEDMNFLIDTILITREVGGSLTPVIEKLLHSIQEKDKIRREVSALTSQGKFSGAIIGGMPFCLFILLWFINNEYISVLFTHPIGLVLIGFSLAMQIIGIIILKKIITLKVR